ncbi:tRNA (N(6)-L-threonylcarbamoyladenosine(37)-C(2))-methylthiotransferase MtaB [candidate division KSB1 bacterium]
MGKRVAFHTLGCKVNTAETDVLAATFRERGYQIVGFDSKSDVCVVNTCTVTQMADAQCRQIIRRARKSSPEAVIAVVGCYAQADSRAVSSIPGVDIVLGTRERFSIFDLLDGNSCFTETVVRTGLESNPFDKEKGLPYGTSRTRAFLKVQDGCSYKCSYCIIPKVRGASVSRKRADVLDRVKGMRDSGFKEIVLTAVNLGEYEDGRNYRLLHLLKDICGIPGIPRIRLTSIEPNCFSEDLIKFVADTDRICPHFHIPLQSGSDTILKNMRRRYSTRHYADVVNAVLKWIPDAAIGADVMTGYPGETDTLYEESLRFIGEIPVTYLHVFRYSPRYGTEAAGCTEFIPHESVKERSRKLIGLGKAKKESFLERQIGRISEVLFESKPVKGNYYGFTENYARVRCGSAHIGNRCEPVKLIQKSDLVLEGEIAK